MVNLITSQEWLVWRLYEDSEEIDTFHGDFMVKLAWRLCGVFIGGNMVNPITSQEWLVWRLYGDSEESDTFHGDFMVKLVWTLSGVFMEKTW